ncbi:MAG: hypothetical protein NTV34_07320, partial [Proteobacteria bacterium]|nr:hypothetical protein [Pseudomonadota bacterium]
MQKLAVRFIMIAAGIIPVLLISLKDKGLIAGSDRDLNSGVNQIATAESTVTTSKQTNAIAGHVYYCSDGDTCRVKVGGVIWVNVR